MLFSLLATAQAGPAAFYANIIQAAAVLAVTARPDAAEGADFLDRLDAAWLEHAHADA